MPEKNTTTGFKNIDPELRRLAHIAALTAKITLGAWVNEAIREKLRRIK